MTHILFSSKTTKVSIFFLVTESGLGKKLKRNVNTLQQEKTYLRNCLKVNSISFILCGQKVEKSILAQLLHSNLEKDKASLEIFAFPTT